MPQPLMNNAPKPISLRERKKDMARKAIERATFALFEANGVTGTTVEQIADRAQISTRTFFRYFPSKESAFFAGSSKQSAILLEGPQMDADEGVGDLEWLIAGVRKLVALRPCHLYVLDRAAHLSTGRPAPGPRNPSA